MFKSLTDFLLLCRYMYDYHFYCFCPYKTASPYKKTTQSVSLMVTIV